MSLCCLAAFATLELASLGGQPEVVRPKTVMPALILPQIRTVQEMMTTPEGCHYRRLTRIGQDTRWILVPSPEQISDPKQLAQCKGML